MSSIDAKRVYDEHAAEYEQLVAAEDADGALLPAIAAALPLAKARLLEVGAGTGRITELLVAAGAEVRAFDSSAHMLNVARRKLAATGHGRWQLEVADARELPVDDGWADGAIAGWVFGHFRYWLPEHWRAEIGRALAELRRALRPGGRIAIIETMGTGQLEPAPPSPELAEYYRWLEDEQGLERTVIRTDYQFASAAEAAERLRFFFGDELAAKAREHRWARVPEHTGLWTGR